MHRGNGNEWKKLKEIKVRNLGELNISVRAYARELKLCMANEDIRGAFCLIHHIDYVINI